VRGDVEVHCGCFCLWGNVWCGLDLEDFGMDEGACLSCEEALALPLCVQEVAGRHDVGVAAVGVGAFAAHEPFAGLGFVSGLFSDGGAARVALLFTVAAAGCEPKLASFEVGFGDGAVRSFVKADRVLVLFFVSGAGDADSLNERELRGLCCHAGQDFGEENGGMKPPAPMSGAC
jgi:hypothetical protein